MRLPPPPVTDSRAEISQVPVTCQTAAPFRPPVTRAAVSPHSQPPTTWRDFPQARSGSSPLYESGLRQGADVWESLCEPAKSGNLV